MSVRRDREVSEKLVFLFDYLFANQISKSMVKLLDGRNQLDDVIPKIRVV